MYKTDETDGFINKLLSKLNLANNSLPDISSENQRLLIIISDIIKKNRHFLPKQRKPNILICGKIGNGKTTTINTIFGIEVGHVGHDTNGTDRDEVYEWQANTEGINIIDLPGLGDSEENDKTFQEIYRKRVEQADGFIIVISPPRPAEYGTLKTVKLLLECGVSSQHIIFGFNKLSQLQYDDDNKKRQHVKLNGLIGPTDQKQIQVIARAKEKFRKDLEDKIGVSFRESQIIEYDSDSGWNIYKMLHTVIEILPFETLAETRPVIREIQKGVKELEDKKIKEELKSLHEKEEELKRIQSQKNSLPSVIKSKEEEIRILKNAIVMRTRELDTFTKKEEETDKNILEKMMDGIKGMITRVNPDAGKALEEVISLVKSNLKPSVTINFIWQRINGEVMGGVAGSVGGEMKNSTN